MSSVGKATAPVAAEPSWGHTAPPPQALGSGSLRDVGEALAGLSQPRPLAIGTKGGESALPPKFLKGLSKLPGQWAA